MFIHPSIHANMIIRKAHLVPAGGPGKRLLHGVEVLHQRPGPGRVAPGPRILPSFQVTFLISYLIILIFHIIHGLPINCIGCAR